MEIEQLRSIIPPSQSDRLLNEWGYDLLREYFSIASSLPHTASAVVELATGTGRMCVVLSALFPMIVSGDISLHDLPRVKDRTPPQFFDRLRFLCLDMESLPFKSDSIQTIVCMNTLHEVDHPHVCLNDMIRVMHPSGTIIVGDFSRTGFDVMQKVQTSVYHTDHQEGSFSNEEILQTLTEHFTTIQTVSTPLNISYIASGKRS